MSIPSPRVRRQPTVPSAFEIEEYGHGLNGFAQLDEHEQRSVIGVRLSHIRAMRHLIATGQPGERYLVLEDDVCPAAGFAQKLRTALAELPTLEPKVRVRVRVRTLTLSLTLALTLTLTLT